MLLKFELNVIWDIAFRILSNLIYVILMGGLQIQSYCNREESLRYIERSKGTTKKSNPHHLMVYNMAIICICQLC